MFAVVKSGDFKSFFMSEILRHTNDILTLVYRCTSSVQFQSGFLLVPQGGRIHLILSAIALTPSFHLVRSPTFSIFKVLSSHSLPPASSMSVLVVLAFAFHLLSFYIFLFPFYFHFTYIYFHLHNGWKWLSNTINRPSSWNSGLKPSSWNQ